MFAPRAQVHCPCHSCLWEPSLSKASPPLSRLSLGAQGSELGWTPAVSRPGWLGLCSPDPLKRTATRAQPLAHLAPCVHGRHCPHPPVTHAGTVPCALLLWDASEEWVPCEWPSESSILEPEPAVTGAGPQATAATQPECAAAISSPFWPCVQSSQGGAGAAFPSRQHVWGPLSSPGND